MKYKILLIASVAFITLIATFGFHACKKLDRVTKCKVETVTVLNANSIQVKLSVFDLSPDAHAEYGICYSATNPSPTIENSKVSLGSIDDTITVSYDIESLTPGTKYYFRGYVMNGEVPQYSINILDATTYNLPGATTLAASNITNVSANLNGLVSAGGNTTTVSFEYGATTSYGQTIAASPTTVNTESNVTAEITGLTLNTVYHYRIKAVSIAGTVYGEDMQFTTLAVVAPSLTTTTVTSITTTTAVSGGNITSNGGSTVLSRGVCWSTSQNPTLSNSYTTNGTGIGSFTSNLTELTPGTTYYVRAYATNSAGTAYGNQVNFSTTATLPTITTTAVTGITCTTATCGGNVTSSGGATVTTRGVCWNTSANPTTSNSHANVGSGIGSFTYNITGLSQGTTYYVRAYASNSQGTAYGNQVSFHTLTIGDSFQGGIIAYILQPGDPGYVAGETHGLIATPSDQSSGAVWGCSGITIPGADGTALGTGYQNTIDIEAGCTTAGTAADICANLSLGGYTDWYLPSKDELNLLYLNKNLIGGFASYYYWSSSEYNNYYAWEQNFYNGSQYYGNKNNAYYVRAVRAF